MLQYLKKTTVSIDANVKTVMMCKKHNMKVWGTFILGSPHETLIDMKKTEHFIKQIIKDGADYLSIYVATPYPGSEFWNIAKQKNKVHNEMKFDILCHGPNARPLLLDESISLKDFNAIFRRIYVSTKPLVMKAMYRIIKRNWITIIKMLFKDSWFYFKNAYRIVFTQ